MLVFFLIACLLIDLVPVRYEVIVQMLLFHVFITMFASHNYTVTSWCIPSTDVPFTLGIFVFVKSTLLPDGITT